MKYYSIFYYVHNNKSELIVRMPVNLLDGDCSTAVQATQAPASHYIDGLYFQRRLKNYFHFVYIYRLSFLDIIIAGTLFEMADVY